MNINRFFKGFGLGLFLGVIILILFSILLSFVFGDFGSQLKSMFGLTSLFFVLLPCGIIGGFLSSYISNKIIFKKLNLLKLLFYTLVGFLTGGFVGFFVIGFLLSLIPHIDQGALLVFLTGPLGIIVGIYVAIFIYLRKQK